MASFSDDFNRANSTNIGADWTELQGDLDINSNALRMITNPGRARYEHDLASVNHKASVKIGAWASGNSVGLWLRADGDAWAALDAYIIIVTNSATSTYRIFRIVNGALSAALATLNTTAPSAGTVIEATVETIGANYVVAVFAGGAAKLRYVDTIGPSSGLRAGLQISASSGNPTVDDFACSDFAIANYGGVVAADGYPDTAVGHSTRCAQVYNGFLYVTYRSTTTYRIAKINLSTNAVTTALLATVPAGSENDLHHRSALCVDSNGYIHCFYDGSGSVNPLHYRRSSSPETITSWGAEKTVAASGSSYLQCGVVDNGGNDRLFIVSRSGSPDNVSKLNIRYTDDLDGDPASWTTTQIFGLKASGGYYLATEDAVYPLAMLVDGAKIHLAVSYTDQSLTNIHHQRVGYFMSDDAGVTWKKADGTTLTLPADELTIDMLANYKPASAHSIAVDSNGYPMVLYSKHPVENADVTTYCSIVMYVAKWNGSAWSHQELSATQFHNQHNGAISINGSTWEVFASDYAGGLTELWRLRSFDTGATWSESKLTDSVPLTTYEAMYIEHVDEVDQNYVIYSSRTGVFWAAAATAAPSGSVAQTLPKLGQAAAASPIVSGSAALSLPRLTQSASGASISGSVVGQSLPRLTQLSAAYPIVSAIAVQTLPRLSQSAIADSTDPNPPALEYVLIPAAGNLMIVAFDEPVLDAGGGDDGFSLLVGTTEVSLSYYSGNGSALLYYTPSRPILFGETLTADYAAGILRDSSNNLVASFSGIAVTNNSQVFAAGGGITDEVIDQIAERVAVRMLVAPGNKLWTGPTGGVDPGLTAADVAANVGAGLAAAHGSGSWEGGGSGAGARTVTVTVDDGTNPLESARVRLSKGAETYVLTTDVSGQCTFNVDDGTWTVSISLGGYHYGGTTLIVAGNQTATYSMTAIAIFAPAAPDCTTGWVLCVDRDGLPAADVTMHAQMVTGVGTDGRFLDRRTIAFVSNSVGIAQHNGFLRGGKYKFKGAGDIDWGPPEEAPDADEWPLPERLGVP